MLFAFTADQAAKPNHKSEGALKASLARICSPKPGSGKLEVSREINKQWSLGGKPRKALLSLLAKVGGDKDPRVSKHAYDSLILPTIKRMYVRIFNHRFKTCQRC